jgi:hypothetical protein
LHLKSPKGTFIIRSRSTAKRQGGI